MGRSRFLLFFLISFFVGVTLASFGLFWFFVCLCGCLTVSLGLNNFLWRLILLFQPVIRETLVKYQFFFDYQIFRKIILVILGGLIFGFLRYWLNLPNFSVNDIGYYRDLGISLKVEGVIVAEPDVRDDRQYLTIGARRIFFNQHWVSVHGKILIKTLRFPEFRYADQLEVVGTLLSPPVFEKFSYANVLAKEDVYVVCYKSKISFLDNVGVPEEPTDPFWSLVFWLKNIFSNRINQLFPEPAASLVAGLLFGLRRNIPANILDDFNKAGLTHVLAISGYNINLMIAVFGFFLASAGRRGRFLGMMFGIILFLLFTGFSGSVIRAAWMGFFLVLSTVSGRKSSVVLNLLFSGFVMVFLNPRVLIFDLSFELSFLATLGIVLACPYLEKTFARLPSFISEGLAVTLAAQIFTTPLIIYCFGRFSLIAPLANIVILPLVPLIMLFSFLTLAGSFIFMPLATLLGAISWLFLQIMVTGVHIFASVPFASLQL